MGNHYVFMNDHFVLKEDAKLAVTDLALQRGYGIFDFFKTIDGQPVFLDDHLDRFYHSAAEMFLQPVDRDCLKKYIQQLIEKNRLPNSGIRITLTGGYSEDGYKPGKPNLFITQSAFTYNKENFEKGTRLVTYEHQRQLPQVKTIDYLQAIRLQSFIRDHHADDVLYQHQSGIRECPRSNFFMVTQEGAILTPEKDILQGITLKKILSFTDMKIRQTNITPGDLAGAREAFITSTTKMVLPVLAIDGKTIGDGKPGSVTRRVFQELLRCQGMQ